MVPKGYSNLLGSSNHPLYRPNLVHYVSFKNSHLKEVYNHNHVLTTVLRIRVTIDIMTHFSRQPQINKIQCFCRYGNKSFQQPKTIQTALLLKQLECLFNHQYQSLAAVLATALLSSQYQDLYAWRLWESLPESLSSVYYSHKPNCKRYHFKFISLMCSYVHSTSFVPRPERGRGKRAWCPLLVHVLNCAEIPLAPQTIHLYLYTRADTQHYFLSHFQEKQNFIL